MSYLHWVDVFVDVPEAQGETARRFWSQALGWPVGAPWENHPEFTSLEPPEGDPYVSVQVIDGSPRVHLDLCVDSREEQRDRLIALGASVSEEYDDWGLSVLASPGGLPFCLYQEERSRVRPPAVRWPQGHRSRLLQICVDSPAGHDHREQEFWQEVTGWEWRPSDDDEFAGKVYPPEHGPIRLLLQRLGADDPGSVTRAHLDLGTDDMAAEVGRLVALGARDIGPGRGWHTLEDPLGLPFCVTAQPPD